MLRSVNGKLNRIEDTLAGSWRVLAAQIEAGREMSSLSDAEFNLLYRGLCQDAPAEMQFIQSLPDDDLRAIVSGDLGVISSFREVM